LDEKPNLPDLTRGPTSSFVLGLLQAAWDTTSTVLLALLITLVVNSFVARAWVVEGPSMQPNLYYGQRVMMEKVTYRFLHGPQRGDVVVVKTPDSREPLIKRVIALPGETIEMRGGSVLINGQEVKEPWVKHNARRDFPATTVPPLHVFIMGDNRPDSRDSRAFGPVHLDQIEGQALFIYWPLEQIRRLD
jgi:signal peptidase I